MLQDRRLSRLLGIQVGEKIHVVDKKGFDRVPERITRNKHLSNLSVGLGPGDVGLNYPIMCKAIKRLSEGVGNGNGFEYANDLSRLAHVTSRSAIFPEMREMVGNSFDENNRELFVRPNRSLISLIPMWDSISQYIRAGGVGHMTIGGLNYNLDDFRLLISLINSGGSIQLKIRENTQILNDSGFSGDFATVGPSSMCTRSLTSTIGIFVPGCYRVVVSQSAHLQDSC